LSTPKTDRSEQEIKDFWQFLDLLADPTRRNFEAFQQGLAASGLVNETKSWVVDAKAEKPDSPPGRIAVRVHDCWMVLYSTDEMGLYTKDPKRAIIRRLAVFCQREEAGPGR
jgi:hypothetical protein